MHITAEARAILEQRLNAAIQAGTVPKRTKLRVKSAPTGGERNEHRFFCVNTKGKEITALGEVVGNVTVCG
jgi:hypothetical protein